MTEKQEKRHQQYLKYYSNKKNRKNTLIRVNKYRKENYDRVLENSRYQRRSKRGKLVAIFNAQIQRSKKNKGHKNFHKVHYKIEFLLNRFLNDPKYNKIYNNWVKSNYKKELSPSIDRINPQIGYTENNIQIVTWKFNLKKARKEKLPKKVILLNTNTIFRSIKEASILTKVSQSHIYYCVNNKGFIMKNGYKWEYVA